MNSQIGREPQKGKAIGEIMSFNAFVFLGSEYQRNMNLVTLDKHLSLSFF